MKSEDIEQSATKDASTSEEHAVSRRHWILAGLGVTAGLAGAMVA